MGNLDNKLQQINVMFKKENKEKVISFFKDEFGTAGDIIFNDESILEFQILSDEDFEHSDTLKELKKLITYISFVELKPTENCFEWEVGDDEE